MHSGQLRAVDDRKNHLVTRGNVDGIVSAALFLASDPGTRVTFVPSGDAAVEVLRRDISSESLYLVDLGMTPRLLKTLNQKAKSRQRLVYLDHHEQSEGPWQEAHPEVEGVVKQGLSAAGVAYEYLGLNGAHEHLVALADLVEYCQTDRLRRTRDSAGSDRVEEEARILDFSWRYKVDDDRFRTHAAHRLATGKWPSEVTEVRGRFLQMENEGRWDRALERVRRRIQVKHEVALLEFGRRKPSLFGFGSRAVSEVARQEGAKVALMINKRPQVSSLSMRRTGELDAGFNLGQFVTDFTELNGIVGGGHPYAAGAKIPTRTVPEFVREVHCLA